ncbi:MBL fold metallo-hydrolase [Bradyrhizobium sp. SYSU BS000235]|uniref:MBL fold metallo-hydrolase n=1 Tax=Bradyrhizobium sp. SYSU BS000235 TaxID=3411332 RepID=UPI003C78D1D3
MSEKTEPVTVSEPAQAPYRIQIGDVTVIALSDGYIKGGEGILRNVEPDAAADVLRAANRYPPVVYVNAFVVQTIGRTMLIDTGSGSYMGRRAGTLASSLDAAGIAATDIDTVFLTHIHPDHIGGLTNNGEARFPNAEVAVHAAEVAHWMDDATMQQAHESQRALFFEAPRQQLAPYRDRLRLFNDDSVFPGMAALAAPGHTPGHTTCLINSGKDSLLIWGDTVHVPEVQTAFPDAGVVFDLDPAKAAGSRRRIFEIVTTDNIPVMGMHVGPPGLVHLERCGQGYRLVP